MANILYYLIFCLIFAVSRGNHVPDEQLVTREPMRVLGNGFWNIRVPFKMIGVNIGTHMSIIKLRNGNFLIIDTVEMNDELKHEFNKLTHNGTKIEAVLAVHPFHTLAFPAFYKLYPDVKYYGTPRHLRKLTEITWTGQIDADGNKALLSKWSPEVEMRIPAGAEYFNPRPEAINHFICVFVYHRDSKTLHVDDTLIYIENPTFPVNLLLKPGSLLFHPSLIIGLYPNAEAPLQFYNWMNQLLKDWDIQNLCTAHIGVKVGSAHNAIHRLVNNTEILFQGLSELHNASTLFSTLLMEFSEPVAQLDADLHIIMVTEENKENAGRFGSNKIENDIRNEAVLEIVQDIIQRLNSTDLNKSSSVDLKALIKEHFDSALVTFSQICGSANSDQYGMYKGLLVAQLKSVFRNFCLDFQNSQSAKLSLAVQNFRSLVKGKMESGCKPRKLLEDTLDSIKAEILREINSVLFPERFVQLNNLLDEEALCFKSENNRRLLERQGTFDSVLPELLEQYGEYVEMGLPDEDLEATSEQKFESTFEKLLVKILKKLNEKMNFDNHEIKEMFESDLTKILQTQFSQKMNMAKVKKDKKLADAATIVSSSLESWSKIVSTIFEENSEDLVINALQEMETKTLLISITSQIHKALADPILAEQMLKDTREKMECIVQEIKLQRQTQVELFRNIWEAQANSIIAGFMDKFSECLELKVVPDTNEMQSLRKKLINDSIEEVDFSWMNGYGYRKYEDLCTEFRTNVEQLMFDRSIAIMEELSKILCDLSDYQQCVMNECLEKYNNKLAELSKGDMNNEILETAKRFGNDAIQQFQNNVCNDEQTCAAITTKITSELNENIFQKNDEFIKHVRDRKLIINAEISNIVVATAEDYRSLTNVLLVASNYGKDKIAQIHDNLKDQAHRNLLWKLKLGKYAVNYNEFSHDLEMKIEEIYKQTLLSIDAQHCEWKQQLEMCRQKANNFYIQQFTSLMGNVQCEEELQEIHIDLKKQTIEIYEESFPMHCYADKVFAERKLFSSSLENNLSNIIYEKWQQFNLDIDRSVKESVEGVLKKYEQQMQSALNPFDYSCTGMITASHKKYSAYALEELRNVAKPKNINEQTYFDLLDSRLQSTFECLLSENSRKKNDIETKVANDIRQMRNAIMRDIFRLNVLPETSETVSKYYERIKSTLHSYKITVKNGKELDDFAASTLEETLREVYEEWDKKEVDPNELQLCIYNAVDEYNKEMENRTLKTGKLFRASAIEVFHEQALATVLKEFRFKVRQTSSSIKKLNDAIDAALKKYQELNNIRAADYFDAAIGIDLGTTFSCVAIYTGGKIEMIPDQEHHSNTIPSYVFYETAKKAVVGHAAKDQSVIHPQETIFDSKRLIGRKFTDSEIQKDIAQWPFKVIPDPSLTRQNLPIIEVHEQTLHPEEVSGEVLRHLKLNAEKYLGRKVEDVVITVPAYFNEAQKRATKAAASFANINVLEIINEPTAAALAYCLSYTDGKSRNILVFDLGGGTFDVSVMTSEKCNLTVKAVCGNNHLGGEDFDANLVDFCIKKFQQETGLSISKNATNSLTETGTKDSKVFERLRRLRHKCEQAKINLSKIDKVRVIVDYIYDQNNLDVEITVQDFNNMNRHLFAECIKVVEQAVKESKLAKNEIDDVILVGGSSRIPEMQRMLTEFFDGKSLIMSINPDEVVAQGAAYRAAILSGSSKLKDINFLDVNPFSIGTDIIGGRFSIIIPKNTTLPTKRTETYYTTYDYQTEMDVTVYEGEDIIAKNNNRLGNFCLEGIPFKKKGEEPVDITIECNQEGLLNVTAVVRSNQSSGHITIHSNRGGLTEEDIRAIKARKNM